MKKKQKKHFLIIIIILIIDFLSKYWIFHHLGLYETKKIFSVLNFFHVHNYGIAFSLLSSNTLFNRFLLSTFSVIIILLIFKEILNTKKKYKKFSYYFIISGAIGNLIDRFYYGFVIDFIDIHMNNWHFATFNISDCSIVIGIFIYINKYTIIKKK